MFLDLSDTLFPLCLKKNADESGHLNSPLFCNASPRHLIDQQQGRSQFARQGDRFSLTLIQILHQDDDIRSTGGGDDLELLPRTYWDRSEASTRMLKFVSHAGWHQHDPEHVMKKVEKT